jgi:thiol-disulfide isomerase/thioredoxin
MNIKLLTALIAVLLNLFASAGLAAETNSAKADLKSLVTRINAKLRQGKPTEADLAPELKEFDALLEKYKAEKTDEVANILAMKAKLYAQVLDNEAKAEELQQQLLRDFPDTETAVMFKRQEAAKKIRDGLVHGATFPDFNEQDLAGKPLSIAGIKGKVVLVDFWATWCGPCVGELPNVLAAYQKHHADGFEIIGISLDQDRQKLENFIKQKGMTWPQYFDGKGWENKLAQTYGVNSIPATFLLDGQGKIIGSDLRGEALEAAVAKALAKK